MARIKIFDNDGWSEEDERKYLGGSLEKLEAQVNEFLEKIGTDKLVDVKVSSCALSDGEEDSESVVMVVIYRE